MKRSTLLHIVLVAVLAGACTKQGQQTLYDKQTGYIEQFLQARMKSDATATLTQNNGSYRLVLHDTLDPARDSLRDGGAVSLYFACYTLTSSSINVSNLIATNLEELATQAKWDLSDKSQFKLDTVRLDKNMVEGLRLGLQGVQPEDEGFILFNGKLGFGKKEHGMIPANSALVYQYWIEEIYNE